MSAKNSDKKNRKMPIDDYSAQNSDNLNTESWFANGLHRFIIVFSMMWFGIVAIYITKFFGWDNLFSMVPNEFSGFMAGITLPLAIVWVVMAYIDRGSSYRNETQMLRDSLNQVIFPDSNGNAASKMIAEAIKSQVSDLKDVTKDVCAQADVIKRDLADRVVEMKQLVTALDSYSSQTMSELNSEVKKLVENFSYVVEKAGTATSDFRVNTMQMKDDSEKIVNILTPMVNEMVTAAERVKEVVDVNNENIAKAQSQLNNYSDSSQIAIGRIIETWAEKGENLEKTFLRTAENCEEMFRRLDSGISHIENSISEQKGVVEMQSTILDKNSNYLDNKLGEYGKLISLEVAAMIERSNTLEHNLQTQMKEVRATAEDVNNVFNQLGSNIIEKRKIIETESLRAVNNINLTVSNLGEELKHLQEFYESTNGKNNQFKQIFTNVSQTLQEIEAGLTESINNFSTKSENVITKFKDVGTTVSTNIVKLVDSSNAIAEQSKVNTGVLIEQDNYVNKALGTLKTISAKINTINQELHKTTGDLGTTLDSYQNKMTGFNQTINEQLGSINESYTQTSKQYENFNQKFKEANIDTFMKDSASIISELETISIDINTIFNKKGDEDALWKKYYDGDHGVFVRNLSKNMTKKEIIAIREDYENKPDFRVLVDKYLEDFDSLMRTAKENSRASTLLALISGSDIGKVYYIISRALGRVN